MSFSPYGDPNSGKVPARPQCWGSGYESESRQCKGCGWQNSCREHIISLNINRQNSPQQQQNVPAYSFAQYPSFAPAPYTSPLPVVQQQQWPAPPAAPAPVQVQQFRPVSPAPPVPAQQARPMAPFIPAPMPGGYGSIGDPFFNVIGASPAPVRPQYEGESYAGRVFKNAGLSAVEAIFGQFLLGIRNFRWYPRQRVPEPVKIDQTPSS